MQALTPALTLMVGVVVGIERLTLKNLTTVSAITGDMLGFGH